MTQNLPETLTHVLKYYCDVDSFDTETPGLIRRYLNHERFPGRNEQFKCELTEAILNHTISPEQYERLTNVDYDTPEEVEAWLRLLWQYIYGDEPIPTNKMSE